MIANECSYVQTGLKNSVNLICSWFNTDCHVYSTFILSFTVVLLQTIERDQLFVAAKEGDVVTIETLLNDKYIDVNTIAVKRNYERFQVTKCNDVCIAYNCVYMYICAYDNHLYVQKNINNPDISCPENQFSRLDV